MRKEILFFDIETLRDYAANDVKLVQQLYKKMSGVYF